MFFSMLLFLTLSAIYGSEIQESTFFRKNLRLVNKAVAGIHEKPHSTSNYCSQKMYGHVVEVIGRKSYIEPVDDCFIEWVEIKTDDDIVGFMNAHHLIKDDILWRTSLNLQRISSLYAYVYQSPSVSNQPIARLPYNAYVKENPCIQFCNTGDDGSFPWTQVLLLNNTEGWVRTGNLEPIKPLSLNTMLKRIEQFKGLPYMCGGTSPQGYDSSGFTQLIASQMGYPMKRNASSQANDPQLSNVNFEDIKAGDFVFFGKDDCINHAAFCIAFNTIIHAAVIENHDKVIITRIDHSELQDKLKCVRRLP